MPAYCRAEAWWSWRRAANGLDVAAGVTGVGCGDTSARAGVTETSGRGVGVGNSGGGAEEGLLVGGGGGGSSPGVPGGSAGGRGVSLTAAGMGLVVGEVVATPRVMDGAGFVSFGVV